MGAGGGPGDGADEDAKTDFGGDDECKLSVASDGSNAELPFYCQSDGGMMPSGIEGPGVFYVGPSCTPDRLYTCGQAQHVTRVCVRRVSRATAWCVWSQASLTCCKSGR